MSTDHRLTDVSTKLVILSRELDQQLEAIGELRLAVSALVERQNRLEEKFKSLQTAYGITGSVDGLPGNVSITLPPEWSDETALVEMENERAG